MSHGYRGYAGLNTLLEYERDTWKASERTFDWACYRYTTDVHDCGPGTSAYPV